MVHEHMSKSWIGKYANNIYKCSICFLNINMLNNDNYVSSNEKKTIKMPQLVPFYFINQVTFAFILLGVMIYVFSKYVLPRFVRLFLTRVFISKL